MEDLTGTFASSRSLGPGQGEIVLGVKAEQIVAIDLQSCLVSSASELSLTSGVPVQLDLDFPDHLGGQGFTVLVSSTGTGPTIAAGIEIPLTDDPIFQRFANGFVTPAIQNGAGSLDPSGNATASLVGVPALAAFLGSDFWLAAVCYDPVTGLGHLSSVAHSVTIVP